MQQGLTSASSVDYGRQSVVHPFALRNQAGQHMDRNVSHLTVPPATRSHCELVALTFCECDGMGTKENKEKAVGSLTGTKG